MVKQNMVSPCRIITSPMLKITVCSNQCKENAYLGRTALSRLEKKIRRPFYSMPTATTQLGTCWRLVADLIKEL